MKEAEASAAYGFAFFILPYSCAIQTKFQSYRYQSILKGKNQQKILFFLCSASYTMYVAVAVFIIS
jgi:hypothetical protein